MIKQTFLVVLMAIFTLPSFSQAALVTIDRTNPGKSTGTLFTRIEDFGVGNGGADGRINLGGQGDASLTYTGDFSQIDMGVSITGIKSNFSTFDVIATYGSQSQTLTVLPGVAGTTSLYFNMLDLTQSSSTLNFYFDKVGGPNGSGLGISGFISGIASVPEPTSLALVGLAAGGLALRRRRS